MLLNPVQNSAVLKQEWIQQRPRISQKFGLNPSMYARFGLKAHNGLDFAIPTGTPIYAPIDGIVDVKNDGKEGYGMHVKIRNPFKDCEVVLGHLSKSTVTDGQRVSMGDLVGYSGNTGYSTGPHLHFGYRLLKVGDYKKLFEWQVLNYDNGYKGYIDPLEYIINWKGTYLKNTL